MSEKEETLSNKVKKHLTKNWSKYALGLGAVGPLLLNHKLNKIETLLKDQKNG